MAKRKPKTERRTDTLSKERIVEAAIELLDAEGEAALTFRALTTHLATGSGAIYWHVDNKNELLTAATHAVITRAVADLARVSDPRRAIRAVALALFDAIDAHPWAGAHLSREPWQPAMGLIFESVGARLQAFGVAARAQFGCASALVSYIVGVASQNAANARLLPRDTDREAFLSTAVARWVQDDPTRFPFVQRVAAQLRDHDDRQQFLVGIDLISSGIFRP
ncbi:MAG TPA: TetR family transcriptional regulator [Polyangia bacterium]|nr:TetR family transcriptional regulator [Polyangia bacterium]